MVVALADSLKIVRGSQQPPDLSVSRSGRPTVPEAEVQGLRDSSGSTPPDRIILRPAIPEWQENSGAYEELIDTLGERGIDVELAEVKGIPSGGDLSEFVPLAFAIYVGVKATDALINAIAEAAVRVVVDRAKVRWWRKGQKVKGVIYGPRGETLKEVAWVSKGGRPDTQDNR